MEQLDLPGGLNSEELDAVRRLQREATADGYRVLKAGIVSGGRPGVLVCEGDARTPLRSILIGARTVLRNADGVTLGDVVSVTAEERETLASLALTSRTLLEHARVDRVVTVGDVARDTLADAVDAELDR